MKQDAKWIELDPETLPPELRQAYEEYKARYRAMKAQREAFEGAMSATTQLPTGKRMVFGYNFGKLSVAVVDDDRKPAKPKQVKLSLGDYLAGMQAAGFHT